MSGFHPLLPGIALMRRFRLRGKLLLLAASSVLPLLLAMAVLAAGLMKRVTSLPPEARYRFTRA